MKVYSGFSIYTPLLTEEVFLCRSWPYEANILRHAVLVPLSDYHRTKYYLLVYSVPARLGKGQGAKEIGHNRAHERPKCGHNLVRKRHKIFYA